VVGGNDGILCGKLWFYRLEVLVDNVDMIHGARGRRKRGGFFDTGRRAICMHHHRWLVFFGSNI